MLTLDFSAQIHVVDLALFMMLKGLGIKFCE